MGVSPMPSVAEPSEQLRVDEVESAVNVRPGQDGHRPYHGRLARAERCRALQPVAGRRSGIRWQHAEWPRWPWYVPRASRPCRVLPSPAISYRVDDPLTEERKDAEPQSVLSCSLRLGVSSNVVF